MSTVVEVQLDSIVVEATVPAAPAIHVLPGQRPHVEVIFAGTQGPPGSFWKPTEVRGTRTVTAADLELGGFALPSLPASNLSFVIDGVSIVYGPGRDLDVQGTLVTWRGQGLDGKLVEGDEIHYRYFV